MYECERCWHEVSEDEICVVDIIGAGLSWVCPQCAEELEAVENE